MNRKYGIGIVLYCLLHVGITAAVYASTLSIQLIQLDPLHTDVSDTSLLMEEAVMDYLFDQGFIVSNSPVISGEKNIEPGSRIALYDAQSGSFDYIAFITITYDASQSANPNANLLSHIQTAQWQLVRVSDNSAVAAGKRNPKIIKPEDDSADGIENFAKQIAAAIAAGFNKR
ncbi:hypothetical protein [Treponema brennaborense]|uniref:Uncharacterized protein n=1 Tax=Treponema brennaborense (strain DSM 12168 / CIP 105900 / DD5/3) TaxID=906968 RepID=F4LQH1_TREBD|nr:hypothetical protein [Treponema brennaborense]AEE17180.1 hypothetical protein Trebr_1758 [Treponema brennaborense DSM 12168]